MRSLSFILVVFTWLITRSAICGSCAEELEAEARRHRSILFNYETGLWGVSRSELEALTQLIHSHLEETVIDIYVIGSRASGKSSIAQSKPSIYSDLDFLVHLEGPSTSNIGRKLEVLDKAIKSFRNLPFQVEVHTTTTDTNTPLKNGDEIIAYNGGQPGYYTIIPSTTPPWSRADYPKAVRIPINSTLLRDF